MCVVERPLIIATLKGLTVLLAILFGWLWFTAWDLSNIPPGWDGPESPIIGEFYICRVVLVFAVTLGLLFLPARHALKISLWAVVAIVALIGIERILLWSPFARSMIFDIVYGVMISGIGFLLRRPGQQP